VRATLADFSFVLLMAAAVGMSVADDVPPTARRRIVIFYTHRDFAPINLDWDRGIRHGLASDFPTGLKLAGLLPL
jgi:hypothetical protein